MSKARLAATLDTTTPAKKSIGAVAPEETLARKAKLHPSRFHLETYAHSTWAVHLEQGTRFEDTLDPAFWAHVAEAKLRANDTIMVYPADGSYRAALAVRQAGRLFAHVDVLWKVDFEPMQLDVSSKFEVLFADPQTKWAVVRIKDKAVMQGGFDTQSAAMTWLGIHARTLAS